MKKLLLTLGTAAAVAAPVASVIACGNNDVDKTPTFKAIYGAEDYKDASKAQFSITGFGDFTMVSPSNDLGRTFLIPNKDLDLEINAPISANIVKVKGSSLSYLKDYISTHEANWADAKGTPDKITADSFVPTAISVERLLKPLDAAVAPFNGIIVADAAHKKLLTSNKASEVWCLADEAAFDSAIITKLTDAAKTSSGADASKFTKFKLKLA